MARKYSNGRNRPSWARFFNDWKNPSSWWTGHTDPIEDEEQPIDRAKAIKRQSPIKRTVNKVLKPNRIDNHEKA